MKSIGWKFFKVVATVLLAAPFQAQDNYDLRLSLDTLACAENQACYNIEIKAVNQAWKLGRQNYRLYYDSEFATYNEQTGTLLLSSTAYGSFVLQSHRNGIDAGSIGGPLGFEKNLGFINFSIQIEDSEFAVEIDDKQWIPTARLCFDYTDRILSPGKHMSIVLARKQLTKAYAQAYVNITSLNQNNAINPIHGRSYSDIDWNSGDESYLISCGESENPLNSINLSGRITGMDDMALLGVRIVAQGFHGYDILTDESGEFTFDLVRGYFYNLIPFKNDNFLDGVNEVDFNLLMDHISGEKTFTSPYQYIAGDINADGFIDLKDAAELFALMAGIKTNFDHNTSYVFLDKSFEFTDPRHISPLRIAYPSYLNYEPLISSLYNQDFLGIKIGDISGASCISCPVSAINLDAGLRSEEATTDMNVYPNPASENIFIRFNQLTPGNAQVLINSLNGKVLINKVFNNISSYTILSVDISGLSTGIYLVEIVQNKERIVQKIVVN